MNWANRTARAAEKKKSTILHILQRMWALNTLGNSNGERSKWLDHRLLSTFAALMLNCKLQFRIAFIRHLAICGSRVWFIHFFNIFFLFFSLCHFFWPQFFDSIIFFLLACSLVDDKSLTGHLFTLGSEHACIQDTFKLDLGVSYASADFKWCK